MAEDNGVSSELVVARTGGVVVVGATGGGCALDVGRARIKRATL